MTSLRSELPLAPPAGMRDLLPPDAERQAELAACVSCSFAAFGYERVSTPPFEHAHVLERGMRDRERGSLVRFVESESGEVALLRPDITPQVARIVATRLRDRPMPQRLSYQGTTLRRPRGRARTQRQILQAGIECVGLSGPASDAEVIEAACHAARDSGLREFRVELHDVRVGREALSHVPEAARGAAERALSAKDARLLETLLSDAGLGRRQRRPLLRLTEHYGEFDSVMKRARRSLRDAASREALDRLERVRDHLAYAAVDSALDLDLGEVRGQAYYTGVSFALLAHGPGEAIGVGGRYDHLLARFGAPYPATGFAMDLGHLAWALRAAGVRRPTRGPLRITLSGDGPDARAWAAALREAGVRVTRVGELEGRAAMAHATAWGADALFEVERKRPRLTRARDGVHRGAPQTPTPDSRRELCAWLGAELDTGTGASTVDSAQRPETR